MLAMAVVVNGTAMNWPKMFSASGRSAPAAPRDETVVNGVRHDAGDATPSGEQNLFARPDVHIADEVMRRQVALITHYVTTVRAR